jgi:hypothetical protein
MEKEQRLASRAEKGAAATGGGVAAGLAAQPTAPRSGTALVEKKMRKREDVKTFKRRF